MKVWTVAAATLTLLTGLAIGAAVAPVAEAQTKSVRIAPVKLKRSQVEPLVHVLAGGGRLGVSVRDANEEDAKRAKLPSASGVVIEEVRADSAAEKAGFKTSDIVIEFDGERVRSTRQFARLVQETPSDRPVQAIVLRDGQRTTLTVRTQDSDRFSYFREFERSFDPPKPPGLPRVDPPHVSVFPKIEGLFGSSGRLGITVDTLSDQLAEYFGTKEGVLVTSVTANSAAAKVGVKAGDVITSVNGSQVSSSSDLTRRIQRLDDGDEFALEIVRDKKTQTLKGKLESRQPRRWTHII